MQKAKQVILAHKAISIGLALVLILVVVDGGIFATNFMRKAVVQQQQGQEQQKQNQTNTGQQQNQQQPDQSQQQQQSSGGTSGGGNTRVCNQTAANNFTAQYNNSVVAENARHDAAIAAIQNGPEIYPGYKQIAIAQENAQHNQNLANLYNQYQSNLRSVNC